MLNEDKRLLEPGWARPLTYEEAKYIQQSLWNDRTLRRQWKIRGKRPALTTIAAKAYPEDPEKARQNMATEQGRHQRQNQSSGENVGVGVASQKE